MKVKVYSIYDKVADEAGPLFSAKNDAVAWRQFHNVIENNAAVDPHEYQLFCLGEFDNEMVLIVTWEKYEVFPTNEGLKDA